ncbi:MAG: hypothetical protein Q9166_005370 [cf. Caloplaca sp. 2 TL-2023]
MPTPRKQNLTTFHEKHVSPPTPTKPRTPPPRRELSGNTPERSPYFTENLAKSPNFPNPKSYRKLMSDPLYPRSKRTAPLPDISPRAVEGTVQGQRVAQITDYWVDDEPIGKPLHHLYAGTPRSKGASSDEDPVALPLRQRDHIAAAKPRVLQDACAEGKTFTTKSQRSVKPQEAREFRLRDNLGEMEEEFRITNIAGKSEDEGKSKDKGKGVFQNSTINVTKGYLDKQDEARERVSHAAEAHKPKEPRPMPGPIMRSSSIVRRSSKCLRWCVTIG